MVVDSQETLRRDECHLYIPPAMATSKSNSGTLKSSDVRLLLVSSIYKHTGGGTDMRLNPKEVSEDHSFYPTTNVGKGVRD